jgi:hypothetical protein
MRDYNEWHRHFGRFEVGIVVWFTHIGAGVEFVREGRVARIACQIGLPYIYVEYRRPKEVRG